MRNDGGSAFPDTKVDGWGDIYTSGGVSLRDWFAGQIAAQMVRRCVSVEDWGRLPLVAYEVADAMLKARGE